MQRNIKIVADAATGLYIVKDTTLGEYLTKDLEWLALPVRARDLYCESSEEAHLRVIELFEKYPLEVADE